MKRFDLSGWKGIAEHLGVAKRTAERWKREGLPIFYVNGRACARREELDRWRRERSVPANLIPDDRSDDFRKVFGSDPEIALVYSDLTLNPALPKIIDAYEQLLKISKPRSKGLTIEDHEIRQILKEKPLVTYDPGRASRQYNFRAEHSACVCEVRAATYVAAEFSQFKSLEWKVVGNSDVQGRKDFSYVSFGTLINSKTRDLLNDPASFVSFENGRFAVKRSGKVDPAKGPHFLHPPVDDQSEFDYGLIIRIHPVGSTVKPNRTWIACAGVRQRGTSGAAHVLANWQEWITKIVKNAGQFVALVKISNDKDLGDDSANLEWLVETQQDLEGIIAGS